MKRNFRKALVTFVLLSYHVRMFPKRYQSREFTDTLLLKFPLGVSLEPRPDVFQSKRAMDPLSPNGARECTSDPCALREVSCGAARPNRMFSTSRISRIFACPGLSGVSGDGMGLSWQHPPALMFSMRIERVFGGLPGVQLRR